MNTEEEILDSRDRKKEFAKKVASYVADHDDFDVLDKEQVIALAVYTMTQDIGMAQAFLTAIGVDLDLYSYDFSKKEVLELTITRKEVIESKQPPEDYLEERMRKAGFVDELPIEKRFNHSGTAYVEDSWTFTQVKKEVSNADRAERASTGSDQVPEQWEDTLRRSGFRKNSDNSWVLLPEGNT